MLQFKTLPDEVFCDILSAAISNMKDSIDLMVIQEHDDDKKISQLKNLLPNASRDITPLAAFETLKLLEAGLSNSKLYALNGYHGVLIYDTLHSFVNFHNLAVESAESPAEKEELAQIGNYVIEKIDFEALTQQYLNSEWMQEREPVSKPADMVLHTINSAPSAPVSYINKQFDVYPSTK